jgi:hypothetical protein
MDKNEKFIYEALKKENPEESETSLRAAAKEIAKTYKPLGPIEGRVGYESGLSGAALAKAAVNLGKTFLKKPTKPTLKKPTKKQVLLGGAGLGIAGLVAGPGGDETAETNVVDQANTDLMLQMAQYELEGGDPAALAATAAGQQLFKNPGFNLGAIINSGNVLIQNQGVYTGKPVSSGGKYEGSMFIKNAPKDTISLKDWENQFPIANPKGLAEWKSKLVAAGVVSADAGLAELKKQWSAWGEFSQTLNKTGQKLTPDQLLDIQRGLWGGGGGGKDYSTQYSVQMLKPENVKSMYKAAREQGAGAIVGDEDAAAFAKRVAAQQMAKPSKTEFKKIKGKMTPVTTPGYGEAEAAAAAVELAKKDPLYAEFQTANVFGSALERALGVRG